MPELPEVETVRSSLEPLVLGRRVDAVDVRFPRLRRPVPEDFATSLVGRRIVAARRRAKYLLFDLDDGLSWIVHLGMSGRLLHRPASDAGPAVLHDHVVVRLEGEGGRLVLNDPRRFGLTLVEDAEASSLFAHLGPEPLDAQAFNADVLWRLRARTRRSLKDVLMDQRVVAGLGNIYVSEILFLAGLRPRRRLERLSRAEVEVLVEAVRTILREAIEHRGSTVSDFLDGIGKRGGYQWRHRVYDRAGQPCGTCGTTIKGIVIGARSSFYCPRCQR
jgi:formamidopyrimidine-DNA glycosylase